MNNVFDVVIIGGGPAGSTAAENLARSGISVLMIERASHPRYKTCGGGLVGKSLRSVHAPLNGAIHRNCHTVALYLHDIGLRFSTVREEPVIAMTMRDEFDYQLLAGAQKAGARLRTECEVVEMTWNDHQVGLRTTAGDISTRYIIAADGATGTTARKAGWSETRRFAPALEYEIRVDQDTLSRFEGCPRFDVGIVPYGYSWVFPKRNHLSVGVITMRKATVSLHNSMKRYLAYLDLRAEGEIEKHGFMIPTKPRTDGFARNRTLLVGDAAGFADPVTAEGISYAVRSGQIAADVLTDSGFDEGRVAARYHEALNDNLLSEMRYGGVLAAVFYDWPNVRNWLFRRHGQPLMELITDVMMGKTTYREIFHTYRNYFKLLRLM